MEIKQFDILVHPDYHRLWKPHKPLIKRQTQLRRLWQERIGKIAQTPEVALIYFSIFREEEFDNWGSLSQDPDPLGFQIVLNDDYSRINRCRDILGNRFMSFYYPTLPSQDNLIKAMPPEINFNPKETAAFSYGEYQELCAEKWGQQIRNHLGILPENYITLTDLSLSIYKERLKS